MADDKTTRSKLSEKDHKDKEDEDVHANISGPNAEGTSEEKSKVTTQAQKTEEEEATKKKLQIGVGDHTKGLERETNKSVHGKEIGGSSGVEMPTKTDDEKFESVKAEAESFSAVEHVSSDLAKSDDSNRSAEEFTRKIHGSSPSVIAEECSKLESDTSGDAGAVTPETGGLFSAENEGEVKQSEYEEVGANISGVPKPKDTRKGKSKATTLAHENIEEEEATNKKLKELQIGVGDHAKGLERETNKSVRGKGIADSRGGEIEHASEIQSSETEMPLKTDDDEKSEIDLDIDTNMEGLEEDMYEVVQRARKGKAKLDEEGKELDDDPEVESNIDALVKEIRELYRQVTKGTEGKLGRLMKNREEYSSEDEESESESELYRKCEMLLKTPLRLMLELDTEIRGLVEELEELITSKDDKAGPKLQALRAELEALKVSNYQKEVEVIVMVKGLIIDDGAAEESVIDAAVLKSEVGPMVERAKEIIARVRSEIEEVEMDRNKSLDAADD